ncbi:MAG: 4Fe-4S binding protein [Anaerolineae bacterium]
MSKRRLVAPPVAVLARRPVRALVQLLAFAGFMTLFVLAVASHASGTLLRVPFMLDPLLAIAGSLAARRVLAGAALSLIVLGLTLVVGRAWCGWLCPLGTTLDAVSIRPRRTGPRRGTDGWRWLKHFLLVTLVVMAALSSTTLLLLDPLTLSTRTLAVAVWPALNVAFGGVQAFLYRIGFLQEPLLRLEETLRGSILPDFAPLYRLNLAIGGMAIGIVALEGLASRFWCRSLCPLGALLALESKLALVKRRVNDRCIQCGRCERVCPTGTVSATHGYASDPAECIMCLDCSRACPKGAIEFALPPRPAIRRSYDAGRRDAIGGVLAGVATVSLLGAASKRGEVANHLLRPPGALDPQFLDACVRCGECMRACPTAALQPAFLSLGLEAMFSPVLTPRDGYCDYSCNRCGQVCPTGAIPSLTLEEKHGWVIGQAYIDEQRCIPWTGDGPCSVCEEMCPLPEKAIWLEDVAVTAADGSESRLLRPHVRRELCIGCGICENKCPVSGESAIRVYIAGAERLRSRRLSGSSG